MSQQCLDRFTRYLACFLMSLLITGCPASSEREEMVQPASGQDFGLECEPGYREMDGKCVPNVDNDGDRDGVPDAVDNCPEIENAAQQDCDVDGVGDACDEDFPCAAILEGEVTTITDPEEGLQFMSGGLIRVLPSGDVAEISEFGTFTMPIAVGNHTVQVFDPVDLLRARLGIAEPSANDDPPEDEMRDQENEADAGLPEEEAPRLQVPPGVQPVAQREVEIRLFDMNRRVRLDFLIGGVGRIAGRVCLGDRMVNLAEHGGVTIRVEPMAIGDIETYVTDDRGFFVTGPLLFDTYYVNVDSDGYQPAYLMVTIDRLGLMTINDEEPCHVVLSPI
ncbi:MAG: thrombospondin type 3 repeat-containing protein [Bradymonadia bacterium]